MAGKKAAAKKNAAKKSAAKKLAAKHAAHGPDRDLRRAYEHMGRLEALRPLLDENSAGEIEALLQFARAGLTAEDAKSAADLLRAAEHLGFGSLAAETRDASADERVQTVAAEECEHLLERAQEHWEWPRDERAWPLDTVYRQAAERARKALRSGALRRALEYARAAEALSHVEGAPAALEAGSRTRKRQLKT